MVITMTEAIIVAIITGGLTLTGTIISVVAVNSKTLYRIEQLEKKQDKHNQVIERVYNVEKQIGINEEVIKDMEEDIKELKSVKA